MSYDEQSFLSGLASGMTATAIPHSIGQRISFLFDFNSNYPYCCFVNLFNPYDDLTVIWEDSSVQQFNVGECEKYIKSHSHGLLDHPPASYLVFPDNVLRTNNFMRRDFDTKGPFVITICGNLYQPHIMRLVQTSKKVHTDPNYITYSSDYFWLNSKPVVIGDAFELYVVGRQGKSGYYPLVANFRFYHFAPGMFPFDRFGIIEPAQLIYRTVYSHSGEDEWIIER